MPRERAGLRMHFLVFDPCKLCQLYVLHCVLRGVWLNYLESEDYILTIREILHCFSIFRGCNCCKINQGGHQTSFIKTAFYLVISYSKSCCNCKIFDLVFIRLLEKCRQDGLCIPLYFLLQISIIRQFLILRHFVIIMRDLAFLASLVVILRHCNFRATLY